MNCVKVFMNKPSCFGDVLARAFIRGAVIGATCVVVGRIIR